MFDRSSNTPNLENVYGLMRLEMSDGSKKKKNFLFWSFLGVTTGTIIY